MSTASDWPLRVPEGACTCPDCVKLALEAALAAALGRLPTAEEDAAPPVYRRSIFDVMADEA